MPDGTVAQNLDTLEKPRGGRAQSQIVRRANTKFAVGRNGVLGECDLYESAWLDFGDNKASVQIRMIC